MSLAVSVHHRQGSFTLDTGFATEGRLTAIFGASGSGKTTLVNVIAGLIKPDQARIVVDGEVLTDTARGFMLPPHRRRIGYVFQDARLFPHLKVRQNLGYGRWFTPRADRYADMDQVLDLLGIGHLLERKPAQLSGGEKQRVAIGRALLASPRLLLMDEPLSSLDQMRKEEIMPYLERLRDELRVPVVYVSHSVAEVTRLATDILVLSEGRTAAFGTAAEIASRLDLVPVEDREQGGAILDMTVTAFDPEWEMSRLESGAGTVYVTGFVGAVGTAARVRIRARDVMLSKSRPQQISALNILDGTIEQIAGEGRASVNVTVRCGDTAVVARVTRQSAAALELAAGQPVHAVVKAVSVEGPGPASYSPVHRSVIPDRS